MFEPGDIIKYKNSAATLKFYLVLDRKHSTIKADIPKNAIIVNHSLGQNTHGWFKPSEAKDYLEKIDV